MNQRPALWLVLGLAGIGMNAPAFAAERTAEQLSQAVETSQALNQEMAPYDAFFHRDPMQPLVDDKGNWVSGVGLTSGLSVQGIIWSDQRPLAIIDDELYTVGAVVGPYTIVEIRGQDIVVDRNGVRTTIPLDRGIAAAAPQPSP